MPSGDALAATTGASQCNGVGASAMGATTGMTCTITVVNTISGGTTHSTTTMRRTCSLGPCPPGNGTFTSSSTRLVTDINQCNGSDNDAAHPITCQVTVTNYISADTPGAEPVTTATKNQCVGSATGGGGTVDCDPYPATSPPRPSRSATAAGTGGGGTVRCTVGSTSKVSRAIPVRVTQCNGTGNPGGSVVTCHTSITTTITAVPSTASPTPKPKTTSPAVGGPGATSPAVGGPGSGRPGSTGPANAGPGGSTPGTGTPGSQITRVPAGGVAAGGGPTGGSSSGLALGGALVAGTIAVLLGSMLVRRVVRTRA